MDINAKIKRMSVKFINFNEVFIFERKIIEFVEKRIFFYNKIINTINSIFSKDNNINLDILNIFYKEIDNGISDINIVQKNKIKEKDYSPSDLKEEQVIDSYNHKNNIATLNKINDKNILNYINNLNTKLKILNTDRNEPNNNNSYKKIILPSLKTSDNQLYSNSFRNPVKFQNSISTHKSNKRYDIFNTQNNKEISPIKKDHDGIKIYLKETNSNISKSIDNRNKDKDNTNNNLSSKDKEVKIEHNSELNNDNLRRRKSVVALTVPDYHNINNVNDYILNYKFKEEPKEGKEEKEKIESNKEKEKEKEKKMNKEINKADKKKLKLKVQSSFKSNKEEKDKENNENITNKKFTKDIKEKESKANKKNNIKIMNKKDDNSTNKDNSDDGGNSSANSFGRGSNKSNESEENKEKENGNIKIVSSKTVSSCESKDPLDDIKYLKRMREKQENIRLKDIEYLFSDSEEKSEEKREKVLENKKCLR